MKSENSKIFHGRQFIPPWLNNSNMLDSVVVAVIPRCHTCLYCLYSYLPQWQISNVCYSLMKMYLTMKFCIIGVKGYLHNKNSNMPIRYYSPGTNEKYIILMSVIFLNLSHKYILTQHFMSWEFLLRVALLGLE